MVWTNPSTFTTGQVPDAALFNEQIRDNLNAAGDHSGWSTYAPVLTATVTSPTLGTGYGKAHYIRVGNLVMYGWFVTFGSGGSAGSGDYMVSLPVNGNFGNDRRAGAIYLYDASTLNCWVGVHYSSSTAAAVAKLMWNAKTADGIVTHASPFANGALSDECGGWLLYRVAT